MTVCRLVKPYDRKPLTRLLSKEKLTRKERKTLDRIATRTLEMEREIPFEVKLRGETASNNWRRLHGLKPLRRVRE